MSGGKSSHPAKPAKKKAAKKASGSRAAAARTSKPSPTPARREKEERNGLEDILGLVSNIYGEQLMQCFG